ncbi:MAG TPA: SRPBCC family protein [Vicinamibacterales bacterium]|nr:SRPBCC family protein [Vicinamibacterales bacterium]
MLKWTLIVVISLVSLSGFAGLVGSMLPKGHRASRTTTIAAAPGVVFNVITDFSRAPEWRRDVKQVDVAPDDGKGRIVREHGKQGVVPYRVEALEPPNRLVMRIADPSLPYGGSWTYELRAAGAGTEITITENGEVFNPIFRLMQKFFFSPYASIDAYLEDLRKRVAA